MTTGRADARVSGPAVWRAVARSFLATTWLLVRRRLRMPGALVGDQLAVSDGTTSTVFHETAVAGGRAADPVVLVVRFRLRWVGSARWAHAVFRRTCLVNTPLFAGFPGFGTKLWLTDPDTGVYRGVYEWDGADAAERYVQCLTRVLALAAVPGSIAHVILPGEDRRRFVHGWDRIPAA